MFWFITTSLAALFSWSACTPPGAWVVMYKCARGIEFYDFLISTLPIYLMCVLPLFLLILCLAFQFIWWCGILCFFFAFYFICRYIKRCYFGKFRKISKSAKIFNSSFSYINEFLKLNNSWFCYDRHLIYPNELENRHSKICFLTLTFKLNWHQRDIKINTLRQTWCLHFVNSLLPFLK